MIKPPIFWKEKIHLYFKAKKLESNQIKKIINRIYDLELRIKSDNLIDKKSSFKKLLIDICVSANA